MCRFVKKKDTMNYFNELDAAITICDLDGKVIFMNQKAMKTFEKYGGNKLVGQSLKDCHPEPAWNKIIQLIETRESNAYTIEKNGIKKIIIQKPWFENDEIKGLIEFSFEIPSDMNHFIRK